MFNIKTVKKWHLLIVWPALISVLIYALSALTHPLMAWTGPQAEKRFPPKLNIDHDIQLNTQSIVLNGNLDKAKVAKFVPYKNDVLFQVTENESDARRYFSIINNQEVFNHDEDQAIWLAQYYLGRSPSIDSVIFKTKFDQEYPEVNRLLPVYKINFSTEDNLSVYIHTETLALAGISNDWKRTLRFIFQNFHSFDWLNDYEGIRLILITIVVSIISLMALTGLGFLVLLRRKSRVTQTSRRWHRRLAYTVTLPLLLFSISGIYHLLYSSLANQEYGMRLTQNLHLKNWSNISLKKGFKDLAINQVSLVNIVDNSGAGMSSYRVGGQIQTKNQADESSMAKINLYSTQKREARFKGIPRESAAFYLDNKGDLLQQYSDANLVRFQSEKYLNSQELSLDLVTHFGPTYDFRNKRLPVWEIDSPNGHKIFIDPVTHILVDQSHTLGRAERYSFSFLHKWNLLTPLIGRFNRDVLIVVTLLLTIILSGFGYLAYRNRTV